MSKNKIDNIIGNIIILYHDQHLKENQRVVKLLLNSLQIVWAAFRRLNFYYRNATEVHKTSLIHW